MRPHGGTVLALVVDVIAALMIVGDARRASAVPLIAQIRTLCYHLANADLKTAGFHVAIHGIRTIGVRDNHVIAGAAI